MLNMKLQIQMQGDDEPIVVPVRPVTQMAFEREFKTGLPAAFANTESLKLEYLYWLAWKSMHHSGHVVKPFDNWIEQCEGVETVDDEPNSPLDGTASAG